MKNIRVLYLGDSTSIDDQLIEIAKQYFKVAVERHSEGAACEGLSFDNADVVLLNMIKGWNYQCVLEKAKTHNLPVVGVHTFTNDALKIKYLKEGMSAYVSVFDLVDEIDDIIPQVYKV